MEPQASPITEHGLLTLSNKAWEQARQRALVLGLSRRQAL